VAVVEPKKVASTLFLIESMIRFQVHYYQPGFTLAGAGIVPLKSLQRDEKTLLHPDAIWINDEVKEFTPGSNSVKIRFVLCYIALLWLF
jgi:hypothetical protein